METKYPDERLVFVDLETAGGEPWRPIMQVAAIAIDSGYRELERFESKIRFRRQDADPRSLFGSRYQPSVWRRHAASECCVLEQFRRFLWRHATVDQTSEVGHVFQVAQIVAHNATYDAAFLQEWFDRHNKFLPASPRVLCTLQRASWLFHEDKLLTPPTDFKLQTLCTYFGVTLDRRSRHDALADVAATVDLYRAMGRWARNINGRKQTTLTSPGSGSDSLTKSGIPLPRKSAAH